MLPSDEPLARSKTQADAGEAAGPARGALASPLHPRDPEQPALTPAEASDAAGKQDHAEARHTPQAAEQEEPHSPARAHAEKDRNSMPPGDAAVQEAMQELPAVTMSAALSEVELALGEAEPGMHEVADATALLPTATAEQEEPALARLGRATELVRHAEAESESCSGVPAAQPAGLQPSQPPQVASPSAAAPPAEHAESAHDADQHADKALSTQHAATDLVSSGGDAPMSSHDLSEVPKEASCPAQELPAVPVSSTHGVSLARFSVPK